MHPVSPQRERWFLDKILLWTVRFALCSTCLIVVCYFHLSSRRQWGPGGHFNIFGTGYVPLGRVSFSPFLLPSRVSFSAKMLPTGYTISKFLPSDRMTMVILLPDRIFKLRKILPDRVKSQHLNGTHPYILVPSANPFAPFFWLERKLFFRDVKRRHLAREVCCKLLDLC